MNSAVMRGRFFHLAHARTTPSPQHPDFSAQSKERDT
uniref:Uncharacterized protein n=1 Tax=Arundo donax TaxID=35708 RepID=A0A0A9FE70_ARUDO